MVKYFEHRGLKILELDVTSPLSEVGNVLEDAKKMAKLSMIHSSDELFVIYNVGGYIISREVLEYAVKAIHTQKHKTTKRSIIVVGHDQVDRMIAITRALKLEKNTRIVETRDQALDWFIHGDDEPDYVLR